MAWWERDKVAREQAEKNWIGKNNTGNENWFSVEYNELGGGRRRNK